MPTQPIFVGNARHDRIFVSDIAFYFLSDRPSATAYHHLHPGIATTSAVQQEIIRQLQSHNTQFLVLTSLFTSTHEPNQSSVSDSKLLDEFIRQYYEPTAVFGHYQIYRSKLAGG